MSHNTSHVYIDRLNTLLDDTEVLLDRHGDALVTPDETALVKAAVRYTRRDPTEPPGDGPSLERRMRALTRRLLLLGVGAEQPIRVRNLTAAETDWITSPMLDASLLRPLSRGGSWVEGPPSVLEEIASLLSAEGYLPAEVAASYEATDADWGRSAAYTERRIERTLQTLQNAATKIRIALSGKVPPKRLSAAQRSSGGSAGYFLGGL